MSQGNMKKDVYVGTAGSPAPTHIEVDAHPFLLRVPIQQCTGHLGPDRGEPTCCVNASKCNIWEGAKTFECPTNCTCHD